MQRQIQGRKRRKLTEEMRKYVDDPARVADSRDEEKECSIVPEMM